MKKEAIITVFILVIIFIGEFITQGFTSKYLGDTKIQLENIKTEILKGQLSTKELIEKTNKIYDDWEWKNENCLSYYLEHDELEKINTKLCSVKGYLESDDKADCMSDLEEAMYIIEHLKEKEAFSLKNIF